MEATEIWAGYNLTLEEWYNGYRPEDRQRSYKRFTLDISEIDIPEVENSICSLFLRSEQFPENGKGFIRVEYL